MLVEDHQRRFPPVDLLQAAGGARGQDRIGHSYHDHAEMEERIGLPRNMTPGGEPYEVVFQEPNQTGAPLRGERSAPSAWTRPWTISRLR
jgi:hypothetical protein